MAEIVARSPLKKKGDSRGRVPKLYFNDKVHTLNSTNNGVRYYRCTNRKCPGRAVVKRNGTISTSKEHTCDTNQSAKGMALETLRKLTLASAGQENVKAITLVYQVLGELPPSVRRLMPSEQALVNRVKAWAKLEGIKLGRPTPEDFELEGRSRTKIKGGGALIAPGHNPSVAGEVVEDSQMEDNFEDGHDHDYHDDFFGQEQTTSVLGEQEGYQPKTNSAKSGERCFVCGDELMISETLSCNAEILRKACCYLNVRSEKEWFPQVSSSSKFYSFCASCTTEISRIQGLYKKVEKIQSLIFKKVENVEKRIADAEIVDNWMAEAPPLSVKRFEGFRNQVLINYRNKLRLRREVRMGRKMGHNFTEVLPASSAHMFAADPAPDLDFEEVANDPHENSTMEDILHETSQPRPGPTRGKTDNRGEADVSTFNLATTMDPLAMEGDYNNECSFQDFDDVDDAISVHSERETKYDPTSVQIQDERNLASETKDNYDNTGGGDDISEAPSASDDNSDPDFMEERRAGKNRNKKEAGRSNGANSVKRKPSKNTASTELSRRFPFPDLVTRDGRTFMEDIEIITNPPGTSSRHPFSQSFTCGMCGKIQPTLWYIRHHICGHHLGMYKCPICNRQLSERHQIARHMRVAHTDQAKQRCPICDKPISCPGKYLMKWHMWTHLSEEEKADPKYKSYCRPGLKKGDAKASSSGKQKLMCSYCSKTFCFASSLRNHEMTHTDETSLQCQLCGDLFNSQRSLNYHVPRCERKQKGIPLPSKSLSCPKCPVRFSETSSRARHVRKFHASSIRFTVTCHKCSRRFTHKAALLIHLRYCGQSSSVEYTRTKRAKMDKESFSETASSDPTLSNRSGATDSSYQTQISTTPASSSGCI